MDEEKMEIVIPPAANFYPPENQNPTASQQHSYYAAASSSQVITAGSEMEAYLQSFPPGFRFQPTDEELIVKYLLTKLQEKQLPPCRIHDVDIYGGSPDYFSAKYTPANEHEWYFLSPRRKKYEMGNRPDRVAGNGYWKATGADRPITSSECKVSVGFLKTLVYYQGTHKQSTKTDWIMKEYRVKTSTLQVKRVNSTGSRSKLAESSTKCMKLDKYVLYKIYKNKSNRSKNAAIVEDGEANNLEEGGAIDLGEGEANDQYQDPSGYLHNGVAQQENIHQDHGLDEYMNTGDGHYNQEIHVDNVREIDYSGNQHQQQQQYQQQFWALPNPNYLGYYNYVFADDMSMHIHQMHGNGFNDPNQELMLHGTVYNQQNVSVNNDYIPSQAMLQADASNNVQALNNVPNIPEEFSTAMPPVDASNNVQALPIVSEEFSAAKSPVDASNNFQALPIVSEEFSAAKSPVDASNNFQALPNISEEFSAAMSPVEASHNVQALPNISEEFSAAMPPVDAPNDVWAFNNEMNVPGTQQGQYKNRSVMTRPSPSSTYHPYHHPDHPNN